MTANDPSAACARLIALLEGTRGLRARGGLSAHDAVDAPVADFALALLTMRVAPALEPNWPDADAVHVVLFGGTNTGKSTVLNVLLGRPAAGMNVLARFSQHPEAYRPGALGDRWLSAFLTRFRGYHRYDDVSPPRQSDDVLERDGYRPCVAVFDTDRVADPLRDVFAPNAVAWDAPDFSTEEALTHLQTVLDVAALADVVVMTVSDESYADARGHALLRMLGESGAKLHVVANKFSEPASPALLDDVAEALRVSAGVSPTLHRFRQVRAPDPIARLRGLIGTDEAKSLRDALAREVERPGTLKQATLHGALGFIEAHWQTLVRPLVDEVELAARWDDMVSHTTRDTVLLPYRRDYLESVQYVDFHRALAELMTLLQVPGIGPALDWAGRVVRWPARQLARALGGLARPGAAKEGQQPERAVLDRALDRWLVALKAEAELVSAQAPHPAWDTILRALDDGSFRAAVRPAFDAAMESYQNRLASMVRERADALYARLKESPGRLNALRAANLATNLVSLGVVVKLGGLHWWDAVLGPAVVGLNQSLVERGFGKLLDTQREGLKQAQLEAVTGLVTAALEQPARALCHGTARSGSLEDAERDLRTVREAISRQAAGAWR